MNTETGGVLATSMAVDHPSRVRWISRALSVPGLAMLGVAPLGWLVDLPMSIWAALVVVPALFAVLATGPALVGALASTASYGEARARIHGGVFHYGQRALVPLDQIAMVWLRDRRRVEVRAVDGRTFLIAFQRAEEAQELARALQQRRHGTQAYVLPVDDSSLRLMKDYVSRTVPAVFATPLVAASPWLAAPAVLAAFVVGTRGVQNHLELTLGADGVRLQTRWRRKSQFVRYADIESIQQEERMFGRRIIIALRSGKRVTLRVSNGGRATLIEALLREGVRMHETGMQAGAVVAALEAGGDLDEWRRRAEGAITSGADYRVAAIEPSKLEWLMRNPAATPTQRVGAALAMRGAAGGRQQIRVAADVSTDPAVKEALELLAAEDEVDSSALDKALARVRHA
ncbi:MAG: hypothetical protein AB8I08_00905 [Sandaracinaceae bacterium]